tara:strand:- start:910 stop:1818 length:909 start_codon:yes stop_codon:yes gene_type:complete
LRNLNHFNGSESFHGLDNINVIDFWKWAYSSLGNPFVRGYLAEFLILQSLKKNQDKDIDVSFHERSIIHNHFNTKMESDVHDLVVCHKHGDDVFKRTIQVKSTDTLRNTYKLECTSGYNYKDNEDEVTQERKENWSDLFILCYVDIDKKLCNRLDEINVILNKHPNRINLINEHAEKVEIYRNQHLDIDNWKFSVVCTYAIANERKRLYQNYLRFQNSLPEDKRDKKLRKVHGFLKSKSHNLINELVSVKNKGAAKIDISFSELRDSISALLADNFYAIQEYSSELEKFECSGRNMPLKCQI